MRAVSYSAPLAAVGLISAAALAYEILLTRLFAVIHWHHLVATWDGVLRRVDSRTGRSRRFDVPVPGICRAVVSPDARRLAFVAEAGGHEIWAAENLVPRHR